MVDESDSWSLVDADDEASRDRTSRTSSSELSTVDASGKAFQASYFVYYAWKLHFASATTQYRVTFLP